MPETDAQPHSDVTPVPGRLRVMVVHREGERQAHLLELLGAADFEALAFSDRVAALASARAGGWDLVLAELSMPSLDGLVLLADLRSDPTTSKLPVLMLADSWHSKSTAFEAGAADYLVKPFSDLEVLTKVRNQAELVRLRRTAETEREHFHASTDEFLAMLGHELRNPLAALSSALALMNLNPSEDKLARLRSTCRRQIDNLVRLVNAFLDVSRITHGKIELALESIDMATVVQNAIGAARANVEARTHELSFTVGPGTFRVEADSTRLEQVVTNLIANAANYTEPGGVISLKLTRETNGLTSEVVLRVWDTGHGIPKNMLERIFDPFVQVDPSIDRSTGGLGLGLTLARRLLERHGGSVTAQSAGPGAGSEFVVRLPASTNQSPESAFAPESGGDAPTPTPSARRRILLVEDSQDVRETLKELLEDLGHEVAVAATGSTGLAMVLAARPDIAIVDIGLPGIDGYEVARQVRAAATGAELFLVALSGYGGPEAKVEAERAGFDVYLTKPIHVADLEALVSRSRLAPSSRQ